ncbi:hypothetical protein [Devosia aurantiaca]|uniref:Uncharacterized protein n=1 Tax=Devosia aurantiaca TaxID=2714858 RepID=A0A6M1SYA5_9HYPH|nr:hypothetical protein [Devosia aurantiaca]NGP19273.1 hypothetical protein [Devosia aurantiaca]
MASAPALAQDRGIWIEAIGAVVYGDNSAAESFIADTTTTDDFSISDLDGGFGSLYLGVPLSPTWDVAAGVSITSLSPGEAEYSEPGIVFPIVVPGAAVRLRTTSTFMHLISRSATRPS